MDGCPCGSGVAYEECCEPVVEGTRLAGTAEGLMRARYTAYVNDRIAFLGESLTVEQRSDFSEQDTRRWAENSEWLSLEIVRTEAGGADDDVGEVEFIARFREKKGGAEQAHHEKALFKKSDGAWYYDGFVPSKGYTFRRETPKTGRNDPCPCGSGKKFKKCCGN
jgi:SEC-C motif-containing protein